MHIWKREYAPFRIGGQLKRAMKTEIDISEYPIVNLGKGFKGLYIENEGVFELESGGFVGKTVGNVMRDIQECTDIEFMKMQVEIAKKERDNIIDEVPNDVFFTNTFLTN